VGALCTTAHPALRHARAHSPHWRITRAASLGRAREGRLRHATTRLTAGFEYVGPPLPPRQARALLAA